MCWAERRELKLLPAQTGHSNLMLGISPPDRCVEQPPYSNHRLTGDISSVRNDSLLRT